MNEMLGENNGFRRMQMVLLAYKNYLHDKYGGWERYCTTIYVGYWGAMGVIVTWQTYMVHIYVYMTHNKWRLTEAIVNR